MSESTAIISPASVELSVAELQAAIERESQLREALLNYYRSKMRESYHYYRQSYGNRAPDPNAKPSLKKEGALNLCDLFKVKPMPAEPPAELWDGEHLTVKAHIWLINRNGDIVREAYALCSTKEAKYRSRPADCYNTVHQMAAKRAIVSATSLLPLVSEIFNQGEDETVAETPKPTRPQPQEAPPVQKAGPVKLITKKEEGILTQAFKHIIEAKIFKDKQQAWTWFCKEYNVKSFSALTMPQYEKIIVRLREMYSNRPADPRQMTLLSTRIEECVKLKLFEHAIRAHEEIAAQGKAYDQLSTKEAAQWIEYFTKLRDSARKSQKQDDPIC